MLGTKLDAQAFLERACQEIRRISPAEVKALADAIFECYKQRRMVFLCGNGGSGSNASHFCEDLGKGTLRRVEESDKQGVLNLRQRDGGTIGVGEAPTAPIELPAAEPATAARRIPWRCKASGIPSQYGPHAPEARECRTAW